MSRHLALLCLSFALAACEGSCDSSVTNGDAGSDAGEDTSVADMAPDDAGSPGDADEPEDAGEPDTPVVDDRVAWPNDDSQTTSDPWIVENHDRIEVMRPRVMALNFVNGRSNDEMVGLMEEISAAIREGTRPHGYEDEEARPFLEYELAYAIDLTDDDPPQNYEYRNSTLYPREEPVEDYWGFDYEQLFTEEFAEHYGIEDPDNPGEFLTLCELSDRGLVHDVWIYGDADVPDVSAAEILAIMPRYDENFERTGEMGRCAGNGCFDAEDQIPATCDQTLRIAWVNNTRGVGCFLESLSHGIEWTANGEFVPWWTPYWDEFAGFDLDDRYGVGFESWYDVCQGTGECLTYSDPNTVLYNGGQAGSIEDYVPACGNAHFPPNGRDHYDIANQQEVDSTCRSYRTAGGPTGGDPAAPTSADDWSRYSDIASDCTGAWIVWWWQNFPGHGTEALDADGAPMKNWWPFLFY